MRPTNVYILLIAVVLLAIFFPSSTGVQVPVGETNLGELEDLQPPVSLVRLKRQMETFDEYPTASSQETEEESGFWDRVVKVALKIFNRFIEWLNSS